MTADVRKAKRYCKNLLFELEISTLQEDAGEKQRPNCWCEPTRPKGKRGRQNTGLRMKIYWDQFPCNMSLFSGAEWDNSGWFGEQCGRTSWREVCQRNTRSRNFFLKERWKCFDIGLSCWRQKKEYRTEKGCGQKKEAGETISVQVAAVAEKNNQTRIQFTSHAVESKAEKNGWRQKKEQRTEVDTWRAFCNLIDRYLLHLQNLQENIRSSRANLNSCWDMRLAFAPTGKAESSSVGLFSQYFWLLLRVDLVLLLLLLRIFTSSKLNSLQFHLWELLEASACLPAEPSNHCSGRTGAAGNPASSPNIYGWCESPGKGVLYRTSSQQSRLGIGLSWEPNWQSCHKRLFKTLGRFNSKYKTCRGSNQYKVCPQNWPINLEIQHWYCYLYWHKVIYSQRESGLF